MGAEERRYKERTIDMSMNDIKTDGVPVVRWSGACTFEPHIYVRQDLELNDHYWSIRYPEYGPERDRFGDDTPPLTPEQEAQLIEEKARLEKVWLEEKQILDTLLKLWPPTMLEDVVSYEGGNRLLRYINTNVVNTYPLTFMVRIVVVYDKAKQAYIARAELELDNAYLTEIQLPIRDGLADPAPLVKYLRDNPFRKLIAAMEQYADKLHTL